jgi:hypothetical protein
MLLFLVYPRERTIADHEGCPTDGVDARVAAQIRLVERLLVEIGGAAADLESLPRGKRLRPDGSSSHMEFRSPRVRSGNGSSVSRGACELDYCPFRSWGTSIRDIL